MKSGKYFEKDNISEVNFDSGICISMQYIYSKECTTPKQVLYLKSKFLCINRNRYAIYVRMGRRLNFAVCANCAHDEMLTVSASLYFLLFRYCAPIYWASCVLDSSHTGCTGADPEFSTGANIL